MADGYPQLMGLDERDYSLRLYGQPVLRKAAVAVPELNPRVVAVAEAMADTLAKSRGLAIAAPQVGVGWRMFVCRDEQVGVRVIVNPEVLETEGEQIGPEACLSLPGVFLDVRRPRRVVMRATDLLGNDVELVGTDGVARVWLHEIDHLDGVLTLDRVSRQQRRDAIRTLEKAGLRAVA